MTPVEMLQAVHEICNLKAAYFRCMDTKNWDEFPELFTEDAVFDARGALEMPKPEAEYANEPISTGRAAILEHVRAGISPLTSVHHGHMPEIDILSATNARGSWGMNDILLPPPGGPFTKIVGHGNYFETYRHDGRWRIATLKLRRTYIEFIS